MKVELPYQARVPVSFSELQQNPLLVLENMPRVASITKVGEFDYLVVTRPYYFHAALVVTGRGHVKLQAFSDRIEWSRSDFHDDATCNGLIEGVATAAPNGHTDIVGTVEIQHKLINMLTWPAVKPMMKAVSDQMISEFIRNFRDPAFKNSIPDEV